MKILLEHWRPRWFVRVELHASDAWIGVCWKSYSRLHDFNGELVAVWVTEAWINFLPFVSIHVRLTGEED